MTPEELMRRQQRELAHQWTREEGNAQIGVKSTESFRNRGKLFGGRMEDLPGVRRDQAFVWTCDSGEHELWVRVKDKDAQRTRRYATHWRTFSQEKYGVEWTASGRQVHIDHLFPEAAGSEMGLTYVRVMPVDAKANTGQSPLEKQRRAREREIAASSDHAGKPVRHAVPETLAKATGFPETMSMSRDGSGRVDEAQAARLVDHVIARTGIDPAERDLMLKLTIDRMERTYTPLKERRGMARAAAERRGWAPPLRRDGPGWGGAGRPSPKPGRTPKR